MSKITFLGKKEIFNLLLSALVLGFVFSFRDWGPGEAFILNIGIINLVRSTVITIVVLSIYLLVNKLVAYRNGCISTYGIWGIERYWFRKKHVFRKPFKSLKIGIILSILLAILSNGYIRFAAIGHTTLTEIRRLQIGKAYKHVTGYKTAIIHLSGPLTLVFLATILSSVEALSRFVIIAYSVALFSMIPISKLDGAKIFFGSPALYVFSIVLMIATLFLVKISIPIITLLLSLLLGVILLIVFLYKHM